MLADISKQSIEGASRFLLAVYNKTWKERVNLRKKLLSKKNQTFVDLEGSQPIQIDKDAKIRKFMLGKCFLEGSSRVCMDILLKWFGMWLMNPLNPLSTSQKYRCGYLRNI